MTPIDPLAAVIPAIPSKSRRIAVDAISDDTRELAHRLALQAQTVTLWTGAEPPSDEGEEPIRQGADRFPAAAETHPGFADADVFIADVFTSPRSPLLAQARRIGIPVSSIADLIVRNAPGRTVGTTGSAGKTTTTYLLAEILRTADLTVQASTDYRLTPSGPAQAMLTDLSQTDTRTHHVLELTSHHLEHVTTSPTIAIVTNLFPDHQDWHGGFDAYRAAKKRILDFQDSDGVAILNFDDPETRAFSDAAHGETLYFSSSDTLPAGVLVADGMIVIRDGSCYESVCHTRELKLPPHQLTSALAATAAAHLLGAAPTSIAATLREFTGLPQRRQYLGPIDGVDVYDDTIAMNPRKASAGLATFDDQSVVVVSGGALTSPGGEQRVSSALEQADLRRYCELLTKKAVAVVFYADGGRALYEVLQSVSASDSIVTDVVDDFPTALQRGLTLAEQARQLLIAPVFFNRPDHLEAALDSVIKERL